MTDRIDFGGEPWKAIPRSTLRDSRLSAKAKGGLVTLLSHEEGWVRSCIGTIRSECNVGRAQAQAIMKELREAGYADLISEQDGEGHLQSRYVVRAIPTSSGAGTVENPVAGEPAGTETVRDGNRATVEEALEGEPLDVEPEVRLAPSARPRDEIWDTLVECYGEPTAPGKGAMNAAAKSLRDYGASPEEIRWMIVNLARTDLNWAVTTPVALAKHFGQREALVAQLERRRPDRAAEILRGAIRG